MKRIFTVFFAGALLALGTVTTDLKAQNTQEEKKDITELAAQQADNLGERLGLEDWQVFYVDSILQTNLKGMEDDIKKLSEMKITMTDIYLAVQDEWAEKTDAAFRKLFNEDQWKKYLSTGARKAMKDRERRAKERQKSDATLQEREKEGKEINTYNRKELKG